jgi:hypothetical protein
VSNFGPDGFLEVASTQESEGKKKTKNTKVTKTEAIATPGAGVKAVSGRTSLAMPRLDSRT